MNSFTIRTGVIEPPKIQRRNHGGGHSYTVNGIRRDGATTVLSNGYPKPALVNWASRTCGQEVLDRWEELLEMPPSERFETIRTAPNRDRDAAARRGTEVHALAQKLAAGEDVPVPDELVGHVDAYLRFTEEWQPRELFIEAPVANTRARYCGTVDMVADLADGQRWLLDIKTTRSGIFRETALQLAAYRYCDFYLDAGGTVKPMPEVDQAGAIWLKADRTYDLVPVDASPDVFRIFLYVKEIAEFGDTRPGRGWEPIGDPLSPPDIGGS